eukprot:753937-Hanusia_phi.AAC.1
MRGSNFESRAHLWHRMQTRCRPPFDIYISVRPESLVLRKTGYFPAQGIGRFRRASSRTKADAKGGGGARVVGGANFPGTVWAGAPDSGRFVTTRGATNKSPNQERGRGGRAGAAAAAAGTRRIQGNPCDELGQ